MNICVIYGGKSGEHEISLISAASVARNIERSNKVVLIGIAKNGRWYLQNQAEYERILNEKDSPLKITEDEAKRVTVLPGGGKKAFLTADGRPLEIDIVFPVLHGSYGEDGTIQGLFEMAEIPYVGCTHLASAITMDKEKTKMLWQSAGLPVVPYVCMKRHVMLNSAVYDEFLDAAEKELGYPMFVKPCCAGSSNGATRAKNRRELSFAIMEAFMWDDKVLIEKSVNAREIECSVTGNSVTFPAESECEEVVAYIPGEIKPRHDFYDFDAKYNDKEGAELMIPAEISEGDIEKIRKTACAAYRVLDCTGLSRVDFFIDKDTKQVYLNEINTMPGFTSISMFPKMCDAAGLEYAELINLLIDEGIARHKAKKELQTSR